MVTMNISGSKSKPDWSIFLDQCIVSGTLSNVTGQQLLDRTQEEIKNALDWSVCDIQALKLEELDTDMELQITPGYAFVPDIVAA